MKTKNYIFIGALLLASVSQKSFAQSDISGATGHVRQNNFYVGWNNAGTAGSLDIRNDFNQPINIFTYNAQRMKLNHSVSYTINGISGTNMGREGYLLLGADNSFNSTSNPIYNTGGAFSLLHLNGKSNGIDELGYRNWMQTGITLTGNQDLSYMGLRQVGEKEDITETTIAWADDGGGELGPDDLVFRFLGGKPNASSVSSDFTVSDDLDGVNIARFTPFGQIGFGNTFGLTADHPNYVRPQNLLHLSTASDKQVYLQITNEKVTEQTKDDGLHIGYAESNSEAQIIQKENDRLSLYSYNSERMRIMHIGALNNGVAFNPGGLAANLTRIGISHNPATPVTRPLSLLHLGYDVANSTSNDGWRSWMDVGMFASQGSDHVYLGLDTSSNGADAVLAWGDNQPGQSGPDNFKILFTATSNPGLGLPAEGQNGLEGLRMTPNITINGLNVKEEIYTGIGGDPIANQYYGSSANPTATLEVNSWGAVSDSGGSSGLRFTDLNTASPARTNPGLGVLAVDAEGDVVYVEANNAPNIGNYCGSTPKPLTSDFEIPLNDKNYYFTGQGTNPNSNFLGSSVAIGLNCGDPIPFAKLHVLQSVTNGYQGPSDSSSAAGMFENSAGGDVSAGVFGTAYGNAYGLYGGFFTSEGTPGNRTVECSGVRCQGANALMNYGVRGIAWGQSSSTNYGLHGLASAEHQSTGSTNYAVYGEIEHSNSYSGYNYAIYGRADSNDANTYAGFFDGHVVVTGNLINSSDRILKRNIDTIANPISIINQLQPKTYFFDTANTYGIRFSGKKQYGFIAQDVEQILPELVSGIHKPEYIDTSGKVIYPAIDYKGVNYNALFGIIVAAMQEQQNRLESKDSVIAALANRILYIEDCMQRANLCNTNNAPAFKKEQNNETNVPQQDIELKNLQTIILNQNTPNPFAEQTVIGYYLPQEVKTAAIIFYNAEGREINRAEIATRGNGAINVYAQDLSSGVYSYTLIADGNVIDTKRMVKR
ncbi:MAG TPA: tail fiber domain-containing protein [Chitinophagales bacterium]|nr:tail fiber domain-containing protein [Chitinophagales bacterium]